MNISLGKGSTFSCYYSCMPLHKYIELSPWEEVLFRVVGSPRAKGWEALRWPVKKTAYTCSHCSGLWEQKKKNLWDFLQPSQFHFSTWWKITKHWIDTLSFSFKNQMKTKTLEWVVRLVLCFSLCPMVLGGGLIPYIWMKQKILLVPIRQQGNPNTVSREKI